MTVPDEDGHATQPEAEQEPVDSVVAGKQGVSELSSAVDKAGLNDRSESNRLPFSHGLPQAQPQTSRFEQVFAQSQVSLAPEHGSQLIWARAPLTYAKCTHSSSAPLCSGRRAFLLCVMD